MKSKRLELKKLWLKIHAERVDWQKDIDLEHRWSMFAIKIGTIIMIISGAIYFLIKT